MAAGLCDTCMHQRVVRNTRGSTFSLCERSRTDPAFPRYPRVPVTECRGWEGRSHGPGTGCLIITADDYGLRPSYDEGIVEAARAGVVDSVSALVTRERCDPAPLLGTGVEIGLHLELRGRGGGSLSPRRRASPGERDRALASLEHQLAAFKDRFGFRPAYLDGHHHCHAAPGLGAAIARAARRRELPLRSIDAKHRRTLRRFGTAAPDRLVGRLHENDPVLPDVLRSALGEGAQLPAGVTEWMTHPGHPDPASGSSYDAGRAEDLELLIELGDRERWAARGIVRRTHSEALGQQRGPGD